MEETYKLKITFDNVTKRFGTQGVLENFSFSFAHQGIVAILGSSGCGKTTLLRLFSGILKPDRGQIIGLKSQKISYVFQEDRLLPWMSALDNILLVCPDKEKCMDIFEEMELKGQETKFPAQMSGGMRQRTSIARAIAFDGEIFLLDEPFQGIDEERKRKIMDFLKRKMQHKLCVLVTHDKKEAQYLAEKLYLFEPDGLKEI